MRTALVITAALFLAGLWALATKPASAYLLRSLDTEEATDA
jgi:hypothetical protein